MTIDVYTGDIQVKDADFDLKADRLIVRDDELSLAFSGVDYDEGEFTIEGVAVKSPEGLYMASKLPLKYSRSSVLETASIQFDIVKQIKQQKFYVEGVWLENGGSYPFSAELDKYKVPIAQGRV